MLCIDKQKDLKMAQVNFNITEEAKAAYDKALEVSGAENKPEFFNLMLESFTIHQASNVDTDIDLSKYESINSQTKEAMSNAFKHIFTLLDGNLSTAKAEAIYIDTEKKALIEKEEAFTAQLEKLTADTNAEMLTVKAECKGTIEESNSQAELWRKKSIDLESKNAELIKEFDNISKVADQVEFISNENKELREKLDTNSAAHKNIIDDLVTENKVLADDLNTKISTLNEELVAAKQSLFVATVEAESKNKELYAFEERVNAEEKVIVSERKELNKKLSEITAELTEVKGEFNKALGKLEILEKVESKK